MQKLAPSRGEMLPPAKDAPGASTFTRRRAPVGPVFDVNVLRVPGWKEGCCPRLSLSRLLAEEESSPTCHTRLPGQSHIPLSLCVLSSPGLLIHCMSMTVLGNIQHGGPGNTDPHAGHWKEGALPSTRDGCVSHTRHSSNVTTFPSK